MDPETGLQLNRNRFYAAGLGRWLSRDRFFEEDGILRQWQSPHAFQSAVGAKIVNLFGDLPNRYGYVQANPITYLDPTGWITVGGGWGFDISLPPAFLILLPPAHISGNIDVTLGYDLGGGGFSFGLGLTGGLGAGAGLGIGWGPHAEVTNAPFVSDLSGFGRCDGFWSMFGGVSAPQAPRPFFPWNNPDWAGVELALPGPYPAIGGGAFVDATYTAMPISIGGPKPKPWWCFLWPPCWFW